MEDWRKWCKGRTRWTRTKSFPVCVDDKVSCYFSINFCAYSSSCCCIIVAKFPSLIIICSFLSRFCTFSSSCRCSAKAIWVSLDIVVLDYGDLDMAISAYHSWREPICHLFRTDLLRSIFDLFLSVSFKSCPPGAAKIRRLLRNYWWQGNTFRDIRLCHWPRRWCAM